MKTKSGAADKLSHYAVIGAGGFGREIMPILQEMIAAELVAGQADIWFAVEDNSYLDSPVVNGVQLVSLQSFLAMPGRRLFNIAIADSIQRQRIAELCEAAGAAPLPIVASNALELHGNAKGAGLVMCPFTMLTSNVTVGRYVHLNIYSYIAHDCEVGDFVTFAPGVKCNGNVRIEAHAYIGTGAVIKPGKRESPLVIGRNAVIGMGAVVTKDIPPATTVVGNPARPLARN